MTQQDTVNGIIAFARHVADPGKTPEAIAKDRGWLNDAGEATEEGRMLVVELGNQSGTRSLYRLVP